MKSFRQYLLEAGKLFRFDAEPIIPKAHNYVFSPDNTGSGNAEMNRNSGWNPPSDWQERTGMFAGQYHHVLPYAVPRETRWIVTGKRGKNEKPTIHFDEGDKERIESNRPTLSQYRRKDGFIKTAGGEFFAQGENAPKPISQRVIENPLDHIRQHYNIKFVKNLGDTKKQLESDGIDHSAEGNFEES
jgi:hypothetical protein